MYGHCEKKGFRPDIKPLPEGGLKPPTLDEQFAKIQEHQRMREEHREKMREMHKGGEMHKGMDMHPLARHGLIGMKH